MRGSAVRSKLGAEWRSKTTRRSLGHAELQFSVPDRRRVGVAAADNRTGPVVAEALGLLLKVELRDAVLALGILVLDRECMGGRSSREPNGRGGEQRASQAKTHRFPRTVTSQCLGCDTLGYDPWQPASTPGTAAESEGPRPTRHYRGSRPHC